MQRCNSPRRAGSSPQNHTVSQRSTGIQGFREDQLRTNFMHALTHQTFSRAVGSNQRGLHYSRECSGVLLCASSVPAPATRGLCEAKAFKTYVSGIISTCSKSEGLLHTRVVLVVGCGTDGGMDY